ncbi:MAG: hypothetical protein M1820_009108 [Bogoriella megaspora]|nr:MAG: hypothetical protein M1820_009108 [Bogoriella megaspora]
MSRYTGPTLIFGCGGVGGRTWESATDFKPVLEALSAEGGLTHLDTAQLYGMGSSETVLGECGAGTTFNFTIDTKAYGGFRAGSGTYENIVSNGLDSIKKLKVPQVDIFYLHAPDASVPIAETLKGINELHQKGVFKRFGLSNFTAQDVRAVHDHASAHGYVKPSVYQGNYSPVARRADTELFPTLRELGFGFYAYSPIAGGFLTKTKDQILGGEGRFHQRDALGQMYSTMYAKPEMISALEEWGRTAEAEGISKAELAYRWVAWHSEVKKDKGDGVIIGARNEEQGIETIRGIKKGPLSKSAVDRIEKVWQLVKDVAPLDNYNSFTKDSGKV